MSAPPNPSSGTPEEEGGQKLSKYGLRLHALHRARTKNPSDNASTSPAGSAATASPAAATGTPNPPQVSPRARAHSSVDANTKEALSAAQILIEEARKADDNLGGARPKLEEEPAPLTFDYEQLVQEGIGKHEPDPLQKVLFFPDDDLEVCTAKREVRTVTPPVPDEVTAMKATLPGYVRQCLEFFSSEWIFVRRNYEKYRRIHQEAKPVPAVEPLPYEMLSPSTPAAEPNPRLSTMFDNKEGFEQADEPNVALLEKYNKQITDAKNAESRRQGRVNIIRVFPEALQPQSPLSPRSGQRAKPYAEYFGRQVLVEVKRLHFKLVELHGPIEPYVCSLTLFDMREKKRISESFYFEVNPDETAKLLPGNRSIPVTKAKKAIFTISHPSEDVYMMLRVEKVLQGDNEATSEPYVKYENAQLKEKDVGKLRQAVREQCVRLGQYRQPFVWGLVPLFHEGTLELLKDTAELKPLYRQRAEVSDAQFLAAYAEFSKTGSSSKKMRAIQGALEMSLRDVGDEPLRGRLTPSLEPVQPAGEPGADVIREVQEFPPVARLEPNLSYVNNLYLYPDSVNLSGRGGSVSARNIAVKVQVFESDEHGGTGEGLRVIYGRPGEDPLVTRAVSCVTYHNKTPSFYDEIKIKLPATMSPDLHVLFTFYHVSCQQKAKDPSAAAEPAEVPVGYAFLPLFRNNKVIGKDHTLPVSMDLPPKYLAADAAGKLKYIDNKKPLFKLRCKLVSTVYTAHAKLNKFFRAVDEYGRSGTHTAELSAGLEGLLSVDPVKVVQFLPVLLNQLMHLIATAPTAVAAKETFGVLVELLNNVYQEAPNAHEVLGAYVEYVLREAGSAAGGWLHERLCRCWVEAMKAGDHDKEKYIRVAWFLFAAVFKTMVLKLHATGELRGASGARRGRFSGEFHRDVQNLVVLLTWELQQRYKSGLTLAKELNKNIAMFLRDMFSVMDRGVVFRMVERYMADIAPSDTEVLVEFKFDFFTLVSEHEHFVALNLPRWRESVAVAGGSGLIDQFGRRHFLVGLLLRQLAFHLQHSEKHIRAKAVAALRGQLAALEFDERYADGRVKQALASMYFPFIPLVLDHIGRFQDADFDEKRNLLVCFLYLLHTVSPEVKRGWWLKEAQTKLCALFDALLLCCDTFEYVEKEKLLEKLLKSVSLTSQKTKAMLENFYTESAGFGRRPAGPSGSLRNYRSLREQRAEAKAKKNAAEGAAATAAVAAAGLGSASASSTASASPGGSIGSRSFKGLKLGTGALEREGFEFHEGLETHLSNEASFIVLDTLDEWLTDNEYEVAHAHPPFVLMDKVVGLLVALLRRNQSERFFRALYAFLRAFVSKFSRPLFAAHSSYLSELCPEVLNHCNQPNAVLRQEAAAFMYVLMRKNYEHARRNFTKIKVQTTIALSKLVGRGIKDASYLRRALRSIAAYAATEDAAAGAPSSSVAATVAAFGGTAAGSRGSQQVPKTFGRQVEELIGRFHAILVDIVKINEHASDPEMMADLYHRIARGYTNAPDLRVAWLESLGKFHADHRNWAEAAMATVHRAALVAEYLSLVEPTPGLPQGSGAFQRVSPNAVEEATLAEANPDEEGVCEAKIFSEQGLVQLLEAGIALLKQAELYEAANEAYKLLLPIREKNRAYELLAADHGDLQDIFKHIVASHKAQSRLLGSYYRVGFYGRLFEELDGKEFIYKEPKITRLAEIKDRLEEMFSKRLGPSRVQIWPDSNLVDRSKLDPELAYIQITAVQPYFEPWEMKDRLTVFDRNFNINRFIFETPYTLAGPAHAASLADQYKRKTILTVENSFPYTKKRLLVEKKQEINLTPIENSIEEVESRTEALLAELRQSPPQAKTLQIRLQGSVRLQVNVGPSEICQVFLSSPEKFPEEHVAHLKRSLREFLTACREALNLNRTLINSDQTAFHAELEKGYQEIKAFMEPFIGPLTTDDATAASPGTPASRRSMYAEQ